MLPSNYCVLSDTLLLLLLPALLATFVVSQSCSDSRERLSRCLLVSACRSLLEQYYSGVGGMHALLTIDFSTYMGTSICDFDGNNFLICCPFRTAFTPRPPVFQPLPSSNAALTIPPNYALHFISLNALASSTSSPWNPWSMQRPDRPLPSSAPSTTFALPTKTSFLPPPQQAYFPPTSLVTTPKQVESTPMALPPLSSQQVSLDRCGVVQGIINRVVGGNEVRRGSYPWIAALAYNETSGVKFLCAGSLISANYVLTSAHCINAQLFYARLGSHNILNSAEAGAVDARVKRAVPHEQFDLKTLSNDIALIELTQPVPTTTFISAICLPETDAFTANEFVGSQPFVAGWGATTFQGSTSPVLREAQVPIFERQVCEQSYRAVFSFVQFTDKFICAGNSHVDACQGDSGGPLMMPQLDASGSYRFYLLGIVSYGYECARSGFPGVYTRVASFLPWLRAHML